MGVRFLSDAAGTFSPTWALGTKGTQARLSASGLTAVRAFTFPDRAGEIAVQGGAVAFTRVSASDSAGLSLRASNGTEVAILGAGGGSGASFLGGVNVAGSDPGTVSAGQVAIGGGVVRAAVGAVFGTDPGGSELVRVGGSVRAAGYVVTGSVGRLTAANNLVCAATGTGVTAALIGGDADNGAQVVACASAAGFNAGGVSIFSSNGATVTERVRVRGNGNVALLTLPTSAAGLATGDIWNDGGTLKVA